MEQWAGVVLAAGDGVRMKSRLPKVLHPVCGKELIRYPVELLGALGVRRVVVVVSPTNAGAIRHLLGEDLEYVTQPRVLGTGDAVQRAAEALAGGVEHLLVLNGDVPLLEGASVRRLMERHLEAGEVMTLLTAADVAAPDLGRVLRDQEGSVVDIIEAGEWQGPPGEPAEVNGGVYCFRAPWLKENVGRVEPSAGGERYLTALAGIAAARGDRIGAVACGDFSEILGVNNRVQLSRVEAVQRRRILEGWMMAGVTIPDPASVYIDAEVTIGQDTCIWPNTALRGRTSIGEDCQIGPNSLVRDSEVGARCKINASVVEEATLEHDVAVGPFSHLRPGSYLEGGVYLGNYVEVKNSRLETGAVSGHFSYLGDATVGPRVNIGAGTITCNYDGRDKLPSVIEADAFIGCDTMLVAPVRVGAGAATGAGTVVTKDVPPGRLAVGVPARMLERKPKTG